MFRAIKYGLIQPSLDRLGERKQARRLPQPPIVLGGCPRSGTTLLLAMLAAHPHVFAIAPELDVFSLWKRSPTRPGAYEPARLRRLYRYLLLHRVPAAARRWCEKTPKNVLYAGRVLEYYEDRVRFIHIVRDARDVVTSVHPKNPDGFFVEADEWLHCVRTGLRFRSHPSVHTLRYEDLVTDFEATMRGVCDFIGEDFATEVRNWVDNTTIRRDAAWFAGVRREHAGSLRKWERPELRDRVAEVMRHEECVRLMAELGYEV